MERSLTCLRCGDEMVALGTREFQLGRETIFFDSHLWEGAMELEIFGCPSCGKIEFFSEKAREWAAEYECPVCHARYPRDAERCPKCLPNGRSERYEHMNVRSAPTVGNGYIEKGR